MSKVRDDFEGVVWYSVEGGAPQSLKAGDEVPEGVEVGDHVVDEAPDKPKPRARSSAK